MNHNLPCLIWWLLVCEGFKDFTLKSKLSVLNIKFILQKCLKLKELITNVRLDYFNLSLSLSQVGTVWVNCQLVRDLNVPFGGCKYSGIGREGLKDSLDFYTEVKTVCIKYRNYTTKNVLK